MNIERVGGDNPTVFRVSGRLDAAHAAAFSEGLLPLLEDMSGAVTLDFSGVEFLSSSGLRTILQAAKALQQRGERLTLTQVTDPVFSVLTLSGFSTFVTIEKQES